MVRRTYSILNNNRFPVSVSIWKAPQHGDGYAQSKNSFKISNDYVTLVALILRAAFDTVDHNVLLQRLQPWSGVEDKATTWLTSYLLGRI